MKELKEYFSLVLILALTVTTTVLAFSNQASPHWANRHDTSLAFLKRDIKKPDYMAKQEEEVVLKEPVNQYPVENSRPTVDQDILWMEEEGVAEFVSVFLVMALLALVQFAFKG
jgi:hypothetical protein